jgi:cell division protein FtsB
MEREEFKQKAKQSIDDIFARIEKLEAKMDQAKADAKVKYKDEIDELKAKKADLQAKYEKLEDAVEDKWEEVKKAFIESAPSFKKGLSRLGEIFKKNKPAAKKVVVKKTTAKKPVAKKAVTKKPAAKKPGTIK